MDREYAVFDGTFLDYALKVAALQRLSRSSVADGRLDEWGEQLFTDIRVRAALAQLGADQPDALIHLVTAAVAQPVPSSPRLRASIARILNAPARTAPRQESSGSDAPTPATVAPRPPGSDSSPPRGGSPRYAMGHHTVGRPAEIVDLFEAMDEAARSLDPGVVRKVAKVSVNYFVGRRAFCSLKALGGKVVVFYVLEPGEVVSANPGAMRDVRAIGHHGNGSVEYSLTSRDQLPEAQTIMRRAFDRAS